MSFTGDNLFRNLRSYRWRGVEFPCESFDMELTQDHVEHKWPDRDGAHIEGVGLNPRVFKAKALFLNGIKAGSSETQPGILYPDRYRSFITACARRETGVLTHPEFGEINAKCKSAITHWAATKRDGVVVDVIWVESATDTLASISSPSPTDSAQSQATQLDADVGDYVKRTARTPQAPFAEALRKPPPGLPPKSFSELMNSITSIFDQRALFQKQITGKINETAYRLNVLSDAIDRAKDPQTAGIRQSVERLRDALLKLRTRLLTEQKTISIFIVPKAMTWAQIAATIGMPVSEILKLNVDTMTARAAAFVLPGTAIRYYTKSDIDRLGLEHQRQ